MQCPKCHRNTVHGRNNCMYCGSLLSDRNSAESTSSQTVQDHSSAIENQEKTSSDLYSAGSSPSANRFSREEMAEFFKLDPSMQLNMTDIKRRKPLGVLGKTLILLISALLTGFIIWLAN